MAEAVCFDLDDTLYPYAQYADPGFRAVADYVAAETGTDIYADLVRTYFTKRRRERTFDLVLEQNDLTVPIGPLVREYHDAVGDLELYGDAAWALEWASERGKVALLSEGRNGHDKLAALELDDVFDYVRITHARDVSKTEPEPFERVASALDVSPSEVVVVGDHPVRDVRWPNRLGMHTVRLRRGRMAPLPPSRRDPPDHTVYTLASLPAVLDGIADEQ